MLVTWFVIVQRKNVFRCAGCPADWAFGADRRNPLDQTIPTKDVPTRRRSCRMLAFQATDCTQHRRLLFSPCVLSAQSCGIVVKDFVQLFSQLCLCELFRLLPIYAFSTCPGFQKLCDLFRTPMGCVLNQRRGCLEKKHNGNRTTGVGPIQYCCSFVT